MIISTIPIFNPPCYLCSYQIPPKNPITTMAIAITDQISICILISSFAVTVPRYFASDIYFSFTLQQLSIVCHGFITNRAFLNVFLTGSLHSLSAHRKHLMIKGRITSEKGFLHMKCCKNPFCDLALFLWAMSQLPYQYEHLPSAARVNHFTLRLRRRHLLRRQKL